MQYLPVFLQVHDKPALVVGGGAVAARKTAWLLAAGARVSVVAPAFAAELQRLHQQGSITGLPRPFATVDVQGMALVIAATDDEGVNRAVAEAAGAAGIPVNVVDDPGLSSFIVPAIVNRDPVIVAVSTGGSSPVLARWVRNRLESLLPANLGGLARFIGQHRARVREGHAGKAVRSIWERFVDGAGAEAVLAGNEHEGERHLQRLTNEESSHNTGEAYLIGAGPGDPDLLTFRALRLLQKADVILYDRLVTPAILDMSRKDAERIYVGKARSEHAMRQKEINRLMVELAQSGKIVARLKGGDPFIFGRGGEEIEDLAAAGIPFQVVPGITAASGCASYAGIPLTHRQYASSVRFLAGNLHSEEYRLPWSQLQVPGETLVFYMGLAKLPEIAAQLLAHGKPAATPVAIVEQGTRQEQRVLISHLGEIVNAVQAHPLKAPTLVIMGDVVRLYDRLAWFKDKSTYLVYP